MNISLLITSRNRLRLFKKSWPTIEPQLKEGDELVIIEDSDNPDQWKPFLQSIPFKSTLVCTYNKEYRSCCLAKNMAVKLATNPLLIINDPEVAHLTPCIEFFREKLAETPNQFAVPGTLYAGQQAGQPWQEATYIERSQAPFVAAVMKEYIQKVGGWDERFRFWGNDDNDLMHRLGLSQCFHKVYNEMKIFHQWHERPPISAMGNYNEDLLYEKPKPIVANEGKEWGVVSPSCELWQNQPSQ